MGRHHHLEYHWPGYPTLLWCRWSDQLKRLAIFLGEICCEITEAHGSNPGILLLQTAASRLIATLMTLLPSSASPMKATACKPQNESCIGHHFTARALLACLSLKHGDSSSLIAVQSLMWSLPSGYPGK